MGEETDIAEPMSSDDVVAAEDVTADEPSKQHRRKRKKHLYKSLKELIEFYMGDVNLSKDRFMSQHIQGQPFVYVDLSLFLTFNKVRALTLRVEDLAKALSQSEILQVSEDGTQVCRKTPIMKKENEDDCTIYVEQLPPDIDHDLLTKMFSEYGIVDYVSLPRFSHSSKFKGFAFVEFKTPEYAKKAIESFKMKGCCLSPQMAPEELMSIKNFEQNKENKLEKARSEIDIGTTKHKTTFNDKDSAETQKGVNFLEPKDVSCVEGAEDNCVGKERKKRKSTDTNDKISKKIKTHNFKDSESEQTESNIGQCVKIKEKNRGKDSMEIEINNDVDIENEKVIKKSKDSENADQPGTSDNNQQTVKCEDKLHRRKQKRKHSEGEVADTTSEMVHIIEEEGESKRKKLKSDLKDPRGDSEISQSEGDNEDDETAKQKKKRKKKKKIKKESSTAITLGLKVLPKKEWKGLRNKYLNMQRDMMRSLKQHLMHSKWEKNKVSVPETEEGSSKQTAKFTPVLGTVVKVTLDQPISSQTAANAKSEMRIHPDIRYVDVTEGSPVVYLRAATPQLAISLVQSHHWPAMEVVQGDEESQYWNKMNMEREEKLKKSKSNQRGRTKLLKRAERFQSKHITTFESS